MKLTGREGKNSENPVRVQSRTPSGKFWGKLENEINGKVVYSSLFVWSCRCQENITVEVIEMFCCSCCKKSRKNQIFQLTTVGLSSSSQHHGIKWSFGGKKITHVYIYRLVSDSKDLFYHLWLLERNSEVCYFRQTNPDPGFQWEYFIILKNKLQLLSVDNTRQVRFKLDSCSRRRSTEALKQQRFPQSWEGELSSDNCNDKWRLLSRYSIIWEAPLVTQVQMSHGGPRPPPPEHVVAARICGRSPGSLNALAAALLRRWKAAGRHLCICRSVAPQTSVPSLGVCRCSYQEPLCSRQKHQNLR